MSIKPERITLLIICRVVLGMLALALVIGTLIPLIHSNEWWIRIFDFPRIQISALIGLTLACYAGFHFFKRLHAIEYVLIVVVGLSLVWQLIRIAPYTVLYPKQMSESHAEDDSNRITLLIFNVLYNNHDVAALRELIHDNNPDIILLSEPTQWWLEELDGLEDDYPYTLIQPQENHYGMLLYSRFELVNPEIRFLIEPKIPSFRTKFQLPSGTFVTLYGVHPRPPGIKRLEDENVEGISDEDDDEEQEDRDRVDSDVRDAELLLVAKEVSELGDVPVIVAGDFNDVAWSHTTHLFQRTGGLLDPRIGRGFFSTFDTGKIFMRYPLDHVFATEHFFLVELLRLPNIGSDHYPVLVTLDYNPNVSRGNKEPQPDAGDEQEAAEAIEEGKSSN